MEDEVAGVIEAGKRLQARHFRWLTQLAQKAARAQLEEAESKLATWTVLYGASGDQHRKLTIESLRTDVEQWSVVSSFADAVDKLAAEFSAAGSVVGMGAAVSGLFQSILAVRRK